MENKLLIHAYISPHLKSFNERIILWIITIMGSSAIFFALKIDETTPLNKSKKEIFSIRKSYDWDMIFKSISPLVLIAIGAVLHIPSVNLFFKSSFD